MLKSKLRKVTVILTIIMLMTLTLGLVAACGENPSDSVTSYKVTFYDGTTVITTETVKEGKKIENFIPADKGYSKEGYAFNGWFASSDFTHDWSFDTAITKDTNVYSQWQSSKQAVSYTHLRAHETRPFGGDRMERRPDCGEKHSYENRREKRVQNHFEPVQRGSVPILYSGCRGQLEYQRR